MASKGQGQKESFLMGRLTPSMKADPKKGTVPTETSWLETGGMRYSLRPAVSLAARKRVAPHNPSLQTGARASERPGHNKPSQGSQRVTLFHQQRQVLHLVWAPALQLLAQLLAAAESFLALRAAGQG